MKTQKTIIQTSVNTSWKAEAVFHDGNWATLGVKQLEKDAFSGDSDVMDQFIIDLKDRRVVFITQENKRATVNG
jgi:hypothetical protein